ncbi:MAG: efflux RND transporter permease subunit [Candidatus Cryptobacteroides sp.]
MNRITSYFIKHPVVFWSVVAGIIVAGVLSFVMMPKLEDPPISAKQAMVVISYPGAPAHEVELKAAILMEDALRALPDVHKVMTTCQDGMAMITVEFKMTVLNETLQEHFTMLRHKVQDVSVFLPQDCRTPMVIDDMTDVYGIFYALSGDGYDYPVLDKYAGYIRRALMDIKGIKRVNIAGARDEVINIVLTKDQLARNGIVPVQVMMALQNAGKTVDAGTFRMAGERIPVIVGGAVEDEKTISDLLISTFDGKVVRIGDIAKVERTYAEPQANGFFVSGKPAIAICAAMENDVIVPDVGKLVDEKMAEIEKDLPAGMTVEKIFFQPDKVNTAISSFMVNLLESVLIVILLLIFTMGFRSGLIIGFGLVLTVAVSFPILLSIGTTLHRISLGAFIIAMGMLVDNSVVIMDGILVDKKKGLGPKTYLFRIGRNTAIPLLGATVIAASTFIGVYLSPDTAGEYASDLFLVLCVSLLASWVLALVQVPVCAKSWLPRHYKDSGGKDTSVMNSPVHNAVRRIVAFLIRYRRIVVTVSVAVLVVCVTGIFKVRNLFFPDFDYKQFVVECFFPSQTSGDVVRDNLLKMTEMLEANPDFDRVCASQGSAPAHYCLVRPMTSGGECYGELLIDCDSYRKVVENVPLVRKMLRENFPDAYIRVRKYNFSVGTSHTVELEITGPDPSVLRSLSAEVEEIMKGSRYVDPYSVQNSWRPVAKSFEAQFNLQDALRSGVSRGDLGNAVQAAGEGLPVGVLNDNDKMLIVNLQVRNQDGSRISSLEDIPVWSTMNMHAPDAAPATALMSGKVMEDIQDKMFRTVPMSNVTDDIALGPQLNYLTRINGRRSIEAECDPDGDNPDATPAKVISDIKPQIEAVEMPDGYSIRWVGDQDIQNEAMSNVLRYQPITMFLILFILLFLFGSWKKVALIIICFPFVLCGVVPLLLLTGQPFTFMSLIGVIGLIGMMVKNSIVLVDEIGRLQGEEKRAPYDAVIEATVSRVRPVLMASLTTVVGMLPLLGDPMYCSMAVTIMGGLTMGTLITLVLLPVFYAAFFHIRKARA